MQGGIGGEKIGSGMRWREGQGLSLNMGVRDDLKAVAGQNSGDLGVPAGSTATICLCLPLVGLGEFPLVFWSGVSTHYPDDDGCVVHHVIQVRRHRS